MRFSLRDQGIDEPGVFGILKRFGVVVPNRTDCARCYHQRKGGTFRTPGRDSYPAALVDMAAEFEAGRVPTVSFNRMARERQSSGSCRVCSL